MQPLCTERDGPSPNLAPDFDTIAIEREPWNALTAATSSTELGSASVPVLAMVVLLCMCYVPEQLRTMGEGVFY
jgi:hypothetical protein